MDEFEFGAIQMLAIGSRDRSREIRYNERFFS
jgi:hypothetical protein